MGIDGLDVQTLLGVRVVAVPRAECQIASQAKVEHTILKQAMQRKRH